MNKLEIGKIYYEPVLYPEECLDNYENIDEPCVIIHEVRISNIEDKTIFYDDLTNDCPYLCCYKYWKDHMYENKVDALENGQMIYNEYILDY